MISREETRQAIARALGYRDESGWDQCDDEIERSYLTVADRVLDAIGFAALAVQATETEALEAPANATEFRGQTIGMKSVAAIRHRAESLLEAGFVALGSGSIAWDDLPRKTRTSLVCLPSDVLALLDEVDRLRTSLSQDAQEPT